MKIIQLDVRVCDYLCLYLSVSVLVNYVLLTSVQRKTVLCVVVIVIGVAIGVGTPCLTICVVVIAVLIYKCRKTSHRLYCLQFLVYD